jgi:uncharacterized protein YabE (DUF348 family)
MKRFLLALGFFLLAACRPVTPETPRIRIIDGENVSLHSTTLRTSAEILSEAGIALNPADRILLNGEPIAPNDPLECETCVLQIRRAFTMTLITDEEEREIVTAARTVGDALSELGIQPYAADYLEPPAGTVATDQLTVHYRPAREIAIRVDGRILHIRTAARSVGEALRDAGIPLVGLDASQPSEFDPLPADGQIRVIRVVEKVKLEETIIPFETEYIASNDVPIDEEEIITPGVPGVVVRRTRIRYEDGVEVSREVEAEKTLRQPLRQTVAYGTKYVIHTATVDGQTIQYWRAIDVFATSYSPCNSGADQCYPYTASGKPVQRGVVGVIRSWYNEMQGMAVYIPGYGYATIEDVGGGIAGKDWIDLGYSDADYQPWSQWVTMYFLP